MKIFISLLSVLLTLNAAALEPQISKKKGVPVYSRDFEDGKPLSEDKWKGVQQARWTVEKGNAVGRPSSEDARKKIIAEQKAAGNKKAGRSHMGEYPRLNFWGTPNHTILEMKIKFKGGKDINNNYCRLIEFGTHNARIQYKLDETVLFANKNSETLAKDKWILPDDTYCVMMMEIKGKEFCIQIENGPTLKGSSDSFLTKPRRGKLNIVGKKEGEIYIDYIKVWEAE